MVDGYHDWVAKRVAEARSQKPVDKAVSSIMEERLRDSLCVKKLRPVDLTNIAKALIDAATLPSEKEAGNAN